MKKQLLMFVAMILINAFVIAQKPSYEQLKGLELLNEEYAHHPSCLHIKSTIKSPILSHCEDNYCEECELLNKHLIAASERRLLVQALHSAKSNMAKKILQEELAKSGDTNQEKSYFETLDSKERDHLKLSVETLLRALMQKKGYAFFIDQEALKIKAIVGNKDSKSGKSEQK